MGRVGLAVGGLVLIGIGVTVAVGWGWSSGAEADSSVTQPVRSVRLDTTSGSATIRVGGVGVPTVHERFSYHWRDRPADAWHADGDQLVLSGCGGNCRVDYEVVLPAGMPVSGGTGSGDVEITGASTVDVSSRSGEVGVAGVPGTVRVRTDSGDISLSDVGQGVWARSGSGAVHGDRLRGETDAESRSGDVSLRLDVAQDVTAKASSGSIDLTVPAGPYRVQGDTGAGDRRIQLAGDPGAAHTLEVDTGSGDVSVQAA